MKPVNIIDGLITIVASSIARVVVPAWYFMLGYVAGILIRWIAGGAFQSAFGHLVSLNFQSGTVISLIFATFTILHYYFVSTPEVSAESAEIDEEGNVINE